MTEYVVMPRPWDSVNPPGPWAAAREAEGWDGLAVGDHWYLDGSGGCLNTFVVLGNAAAHTTTLGLSTAFANNLFRSPVELAQAALSLQFVSAGRFELGIGAGWASQEVTAAGLGYPPPSERVRRLREAILIVRQLLNGACRFDGEFYNIDLPAVGVPAAVPVPISAALGGPIALATIGPLVDRIELATMGRAFRGGINDLNAYGATTNDDLHRLVDQARLANARVPLTLALYVAAGTGRGIDHFADAFAGGAYEGLAGEPQQVADTIRRFETLDVDRINIMPPLRETAELLAPHLVSPR